MHHPEALKHRSPLTGQYAAKVTTEHRHVIHVLHERGLSCRTIAARLDLHHATVSRVLREPAPDPVLMRALRDPEVAELGAAPETT